MAVSTLEGIAAKARAEGRDSLTEVEGTAILAGMGIDVPRSFFAKGSPDIPGMTLLPGDKAVVKVVSPDIPHKTEMGGVAIVGNEKESIASAVSGMERRFAAFRVDGYTVNEFVPFDPMLGHEILIGYRFTPDFGPVVSFGPGGIYAEFLAKSFLPGTANVSFSPATATRGLVETVLRANAVRTLLCGGLRGQKPLLSDSVLVDAVMAFLAAAPRFAAAGIVEFEVNPFAVAKGEPRLVALDALAKLGDIPALYPGLEVKPSGAVVNSRQESRPSAKIARILEPRSAAVIGVSEKGVNNGRIILRNLLGNGFDSSRLYVVKAGCAEIDRVKCVPDVASLPEKVDLFVLVIPASQTPQCIAELAELDKAESVIVIPGGLEEKSGTAEIVARMNASLSGSRKRPGGGPLLNGGNCLGIRSVPGKYNTLFIPEYKLPMPKGEVAPVAVISQSGAFAICRISKHQGVNPKYVITCGNQMDVTIGDYLEYLAKDAGIKVFAVYVEGFKPLDGEKTLKACAEITASGRTVVFYRAGRTQAGAAASASHTASIAGDYPVTRSLLGQAGVVMTETLDDFDDALTLFTLLQGKKASGYGFGAVSNAGFECVAFADNLGRLVPASFSADTVSRLVGIFADSRISDIVDVHNPIDLTPMADDAAYHETFKAVMEDPGVHAGIVGIVPLTSRMNTLAKGEGHAEDVTLESSIAGRYGDLMGKSGKPWVAVVDSGDLYDPLARELEKRGVPTFRTADRALRLLNAWLDAHLSLRPNGLHGTIMTP